MSVRVENRGVSKYQYVYTASQIYDKTIHFLARMSARYSRLLSQGVMNLCDELYDNVLKADSVYYTDDVRLKLREEFLLKARAACDALSAKLTVCFNIMMENPQGCYTKSDGSSELQPSEAKEKLGKISQTLGDLLNTEKDSLTRLIKSLKNRPSEEDGRGCGSV